MSISMTAVVNIYSVCGGVETSREGEEDKRRWHFPESECVSCSSVKAGQPCMFSAAQTTAATRPQILLVYFYTFQFELFPSQSRSLKQHFVRMFLKENTLKKPKMKHIIAAFLFVAAEHYWHPQPGSDARSPHSNAG